MFTNEVILHFDVFVSVVEDRIVNHEDGAVVVAEERRGTGLS